MGLLFSWRAMLLLLLALAVSCGCLAADAADTAAHGMPNPILNKVEVAVLSAISGY
jgi:hypothetical protein